MSPKSRPPNCCGDPKLRDIQRKGQFDPGRKLAKMLLNRLKRGIFAVQQKTGNFASLKRFFGAEDFVKNLKDETVMLMNEKPICLSVSGCTRSKTASDPSASSAVTHGIKTNDLEVEMHNKMSFHGRRLPDHLISLESKEGQEIFHESFKSGTATNFFSLITNFASQSDVSMCGPASLAMVLNALKLDPMQTWRRPWRWWSDEMFACCEGSLQVMKRSGVTLEFFDRIAKKQAGISVQTRVPGNLEEFTQVLELSAQEADHHVIVSFGRESLGQTGIGHFSPIAAINSQRNLALVLDVARFKYPPYWVNIKDLHRAMKDVDPETGSSRGYSVIQRT